MTSPAFSIHRLPAALIMAALAAAFASGQTLRFPDGLTYNDFHAVTVYAAGEEPFTLFDAAAFDGENPPWPDAEGRYGDRPGESPGEDMAYFFWIRRVGAAGAVTYPLAFRKIREIRFTGPYGGTVATPPEEGILSVGDYEGTVSIRKEDRRFSGWFGPKEPSVPYYTPAILTLTDGSEQSVYVKTDGFLGGIDEQFGTYAMLWLRHDGVARLVFRHEGVYLRCPECGAIFFDNRSPVCPFDGETLESPR